MSILKTSHYFISKLLLTSSLLLCIFSLSAQALTVTFSEAQIQEKVSQAMPMVKKNAFMTIELSNPVVKLAKDINEIELQLQVRLLTAGSTNRGFTRLTGSLSYNAQQAAFYLTNVKILQLQVEGMPVQFEAQIIELAEQTITPVLQTMPVYRLKKDMTQTMIKALLESIRVENKQLIATLKVI
jgi:hypothetical protein